MRRYVVAVLLMAACAWLMGARLADAAPLTPEAGLPAVLAQEGVDDNDDTRVEVQLVVLGIAVGVVLVLGTVLYVVRKRLGLVPPPPDPETVGGGHH